MRAREAPSYSSSRVQRASRLNALEQVRLQQRLMLLEKARLHQARLTNQDIRLTSLALDYILACSGHSPEGRGPHGEQGGTETPAQPEEPCFLYGERVVSRKVRRVARPQSAVERATFRRGGASLDASSTCSGTEESHSVRDGLPPRPQSSPARRKPVVWSSSEDEVSDVESEKAASRAGASRPSTAGGGAGRPFTPCNGGRVTPHQPWEDDTDEVTKRILKAQHEHQLREQQLQQFQAARRSQRYMQDLGRRRSQRPSTSAGTPGARGTSNTEGSASRSGGYFRYSRTSPNENRPVTAGPSHSSTTGHAKHSGMMSTPTPASPPWSRPTSGHGSHGGPVIEDRKPVSPAEKHAQSGTTGRRAGLTELLSQSRVTMSASAWRAHLASTPTVPRSTEVQRQIMMEARKGAERERQQHAMQRMESFMDELEKKPF